MPLVYLVLCCYCCPLVIYLCRSLVKIEAKTYYFDDVLHRDQAQEIFQRVDSTIHWINHCPLDNAIGFDSTYQVDFDISRA